MTIGENIRQARKKAGLTQRQLAEKSGVATITLQQYERGVREPKLDTIAKIARAMNLFASDLISDDQWQNVDMTFTDTTERYCQETPQYYRMVEAFSTLNHTGAEKAAVAVEDLAKVPEYRREDDAAIRETAQDTYTDNNTSDN
ncbi:MAG: helix-turn-helix domain-containing protein [Gemmiger sp.]